MTALPDETKHHIKAVLKSIAAFRIRTAEENYTDTGEAWDLIGSIESILRVAICKHEASPGSNPDPTHILNSTFTVTCKKCNTHGIASVHRKKIEWRE